MNVTYRFWWHFSTVVLFALKIILKLLPQSGNHSFEHNDR